MISSAKWMRRARTTAKPRNSELLKFLLVDTVFVLVLLIDPSAVWGGLLHMFEFNQGRMAKKVQAHKNHNGDLETSQNGMELQVGSSQVHCQDGELQYSCQVDNSCSKNNSYSNLASVKKLNNEELSKQSCTRNKAPSLVARLMGIDTMPSPLDSKSIVQLGESKHEILERKFSKKGMNAKGSGKLISFSHMEFASFYQDIDDGGRRGQNFGKLMPREHPLEDELQKFKKEFEAYQAARFKRCSKVVENGGGSRKMLHQESLSKEKMQHIESSKKDSHSFRTKIPNGDLMESISTKKKESFPSRSKSLSRDFEESLMMKSRIRLDIRASPTPIVILKPGSDRFCNCNHEDNCINFSGTLQGRKNIEDFLEEVRERLKCELRGKIAEKGSVVRASGIEKPYNQKPLDANEVRESLTRGAEPNLLRSESTRSYKNEMNFNEPNSPEVFNIDTRKFSERLINIVKGELHLDIPEVACYLETDAVRLKQDTVKCANDNGQWGILKERKELQTGSCRHKLDENVLFNKELSPRNLERSLSAPASGTSFGRLLLEDRHVLTGGLIQRKLEAVEVMPVDVKRKKKDGFNIKEKLSTFKYTLGLSGKLFGKRVRSIVESHSHGSEYGPILRDIKSGPTVLMKYGERDENSTEVPPSPASVCSCSRGEHWKQAEYSNPISTPDVSSLEDIVIPKVFRDISSGLNELKRQISQLDSNCSEDFITKQESAECELVELDDPAESYVRDLLVASGLYFGSWDKSLLRGDTYAKPIGNSIFEEVEESHKKLVNENERSTKDQNKNKLEHKVLLDLLNESLSIVLGPPMTLSRFRRKLNNSSMQPPPYGKELLKLVWDIVCVSLYSVSNTSPYSLASLVAQDLESISFSELINDQIDSMEREMTCIITDNLVEELTKDMLL
ncbi:hypothetical protein Fmac_015449 [Flemingia macrophylla]|uniref:DUF3741 domain-containing protein n=1 Tax=Flemingia macrophylla TaxID=520843 RepID=A0ABD1MEM9_9FABA